MTRPGIVYVSYHGDLGGGELRLLEHLALTALGRDRLSVVLCEPGPFRDRIAALGIATEVVRWSRATPRPAKWLTSALAGLRLAVHVRRRSAGAVFANTYDDLLLAGRVARGMGLPVIWRSHADLFPNLHRYPVERQRRTVALVRQLADRILATTRYDREIMIEAGIPDEAVSVVPLGVDLAAYAQARAQRAALRRELRVAPGVVLIGMIGRLVPQKGHGVFLEALATVMRARVDVRAIIVGDATADGADPDGFRAALQARARDLGLSDRVIFTGFRDDMPAVMNGLDLFVHASLKEPFGSVIVEAMAASVPVIASRTPGPQEIIEDGITGVLTPPGEAPALAAAMRRLVEDPERRARLGEAGRRHAERTYDLRQTIALFDQHLLDLLGSRTSAPPPARPVRFAP
jgi:glycosyltransferase involved in cell wall biosynthesis